TPSPQEAELYAAIVEYVRTSGAWPGSARLTLRAWMEAAGSGMHALAAQLANAQHAKSPEIRQAASELQQRIDRLGGVDASKLARLIELIRLSRDKTLIFTRYRSTVDAIAQVLRAAGIEYVEFHGGMSGNDKDRAVELFKSDEIQCMVATEVGGEGRNLQFANVLINFDLPWNPMKIEQRIGRLHRIGQTKEVR